MDVLIDGKPFTAECDTYTSVLDAARLHAATNGRLVVGVEVNGRLLSGDEVSSLYHAEHFGTAKIRLTTERPEALVHSALVDASEILRSTDGPRDSAVRHIRGARMGDALRDIEIVSKQWQRVRETVDQAAELLGVSVPTLMGNRAAGPRPASAGVSPTETLGVCLTELARCVRDADWSGLADVLEFDLAEQTTEWFDHLMSAAGRIAKAGESARRVA